MYDYNYDYYTDGKRVNYCGGAAQERMIKNGWTLMLSEFRESPSELYTRLKKYGYSQVKVYYEGTAIPGIHAYFAFVKR